MAEREASAIERFLASLGNVGPQKKEPFFLPNEVMMPPQKGIAGKAPAPQAQFLEGVMDPATGLRGVPESYAGVKEGNVQPDELSMATERNEMERLRKAKKPSPIMQQLAGR